MVKFNINHIFTSIQKIKTSLLFVSVIFSYIPVNGQWVHDWANITIDDLTAFQLNDSTEVRAKIIDGGYEIQKRVLVEKNSISGNKLIGGRILRNLQGEKIGKTHMDLTFKDQSAPPIRRLSKKYSAIIINGNVTSSAFVRDSWPEKALVKLINKKRVGAFWVVFEKYLKKFQFQKIDKNKLPEEIINSSLDVYVLAFKNYLNQNKQGFRMIIFTRGNSFIQCVLLSDNNLIQNSLEFPKIKLFEREPFGDLYHFSKPNRYQSEGFELVAYDLLPFEE